MSTPTGHNHPLSKLEISVKEELALAESSDPEEAINVPMTEWRLDPADAQRDEVGLQSLLGAVEALENDARFLPSEDE